jgi:two-component system phosphate regulon sensor histidine kinase PhoR
MLSFRKKVFFSDLALFLTFIVVLFPLIHLEFGFLFVCACILLLYSIMTWAILYRLSSPIQKILDAILPYQEGRVEFLPRIDVNPLSDTDEFSKLASTLNSLTEKIETQIEHLTYQRKETEEILQSLGEGVIALDTEAKVTFANQISCHMLGVSHDAIVGLSLNQVTAQADALSKKCHELILQTLQTSESITERWGLNANSSMFLHLISMPRAEQHGAILVIQDKTSDYKIVEMGKDFIANASHELRTPITIIRGFAETLQDIPHLSPKMFKEITEKIVRTCGRLNHLVKSLLILADVENLSEDKFYPTDLVALLEHCSHLLLTAHPEVQLSIKNQLPRLLITADSDLLDLAIMNLLENSVKYSNAPAQIEMTLEKTEDHISLSIADKGIGIPEANIPYVFDRFYTVDKARSRKSGGAGLGLSIVKTVVEKHKGTLKLSSEVGMGSVFTICFSKGSSNNKF